MSMERIGNMVCANAAGGLPKMTLLLACCTPDERASLEHAFGDGFRLVLAHGAD